MLGKISHKPQSLEAASTKKLSVFNSSISSGTWEQGHYENPLPIFQEFYKSIGVTLVLAIGYSGNIRTWKPAKSINQNSPPGSWLETLTNTQPIITLSAILTAPFLDLFSLNSNYELPTMKCKFNTSSNTLPSHVFIFRSCILCLMILNKNQVLSFSIHSLLLVLVPQQLV